MKETTTPTQTITSLPSFAERGTAIAKRLEEIKANPKYQALPEDHKARVRADLYDKTVPKSYAGFHLPIPNKETWVGATGRDTTLRVPGAKDEKLSETYSDPRNKQFGQDFIVGASKALDGIALFGAKVTNKAFSAMFHLNEEYSHKTDEMLKVQVPEYRVAKQVQRKMENFIDAQHAKIQSDDFWLETHPRDTIVGKLASNSGELVATLPLYEAVGAVGVGAKIFKGANLSAKLATSPVGQFVANRLSSSTDMFISSLIESGGNKQQAGGAAIGSALIESAGLGIGKGLKIAAAPLIKKWTANTIAMGGIPFAQDVAQSSFHESEQEIEHEINITNGGTGEHLAALRESAMQREKLNPIMAKLHAGEKVSQGSIAMQLYSKPLRNLSKNQRELVFAKRLQLIQEAAVEAPVHLPELEKHEVAQSISQERKSNPVFNSLATSLEKLGVQLPEAVSENNIAQIAKETGISNVKAATKKLDKVAAPTKSVGADLNAYHNIQKEVYAYYRNARNRKELSSSVGTVASGNYDKLYDTLKKADGGLQFEKPLQRLLFHYGNKKSLPPAIAQSILTNVRKTKGLENAPVKRVEEMAANLHNHMYDMAQSGHLTKEGNIYASTKIDGTYTKWQKILSKESDMEVIRSAQMALSKHPRALRGFNTTIKALQKQSFQAKSAEERATYKRIIAESSGNILTHMSDTKLGGIIQ